LRKLDKSHEERIAEEVGLVTVYHYHWRSWLLVLTDNLRYGNTKHVVLLFYLVSSLRVRLEELQIFIFDEKS
jgi:hypothetical protein